MLGILTSEKKKSVVAYGHDDKEWDLTDDSEKIEWEEHYKSRSGKWREEGLT